MKTKETRIKTQYTIFNFLLISFLLAIFWLIGALINMNLELEINNMVVIRLIILVLLSVANFIILYKVLNSIGENGFKNYQEELEKKRIKSGLHSIYKGHKIYHKNKIYYEKILFFKFSKSESINKLRQLIDHKEKLVSMYRKNYEEKIGKKYNKTFDNDKIYLQAHKNKNE